MQNSEIFYIAKRENNSKRGFLLVQRFQAKHIPARPEETLAMITCLGDKLAKAYSDIPPERILIVGFAETATAIGTHVASVIGSCYIQTTRENVQDAVFLYFSEEHSHATEQRLVRNGLDSVMKNIDLVVFVDDEVTTGKTILNIISVMKREFSVNAHFAAASVLNGMNEEKLRVFSEKGIDTHFLYKLDNASFEKTAQSFATDGKVIPADISKPTVMPVELPAVKLKDPKKICFPGEYDLSKLKEAVTMINVKSEETVLVLGTEECMYPAVMLASIMGTAVSHSTTRSPIAVSNAEEYPLHTRYELPSFYDPARQTYIYDLKRYSMVIIVTDSSDIPEVSLNSLMNALISAGNEKICLLRTGENI